MNINNYETFSDLIKLPSYNYSLPAIPDTKEDLQSYITLMQKASEFAKYVMKNPDIPADKYKFWDTIAREAANKSLDASIKLRDTLVSISTNRGRRTDLMSNFEVHNNNPTKKQILENEFGINCKTAWKISQLTQQAVDAEKHRAEQVGDYPSLEGAYRYIRLKEKIRNLGQKNAEIVKLRDIAEYEIISEKSFDIVYTDLNSINLMPITDISDSSMLFICCTNYELSEAIIKLKEFQFKYEGSISYIISNPQNQQDNQNRNSWVQQENSYMIIGSKGNPIRYIGSKVPSVCREIEAGNKNIYFKEIIQHAYPTQYKLDLVSTKSMNETWVVPTKG